MEMYLAATTTCRNRYNAGLNVERYSVPSIIRKEGDFHIVYRLRTSPVKPGQFAFIVRDDDEKLNWPE